MILSIEFKKNGLQNLYRLQKEEFDVNVINEKVLEIKDIMVIGYDENCDKNILMIRDENDNYYSIKLDDIEVYTIRKTK